MTKVNVYEEESQNGIGKKNERLKQHPTRYGLQANKIAQEPYESVLDFLINKELVSEPAS